MKYLLVLILLSGFIILPVFTEESKNPTLIIDTIEIPSYEFNKILRDTDIITMQRTHAIAWQVTIDNNLLYANPDGDAVLRIYDKDNPEDSRGNTGQCHHSSRRWAEREFLPLRLISTLCH